MVTQVSNWQFFPLKFPVQYARLSAIMLGSNCRSFRGRKEESKVAGSSPPLALLLVV